MGFTLFVALYGFSDLIKVLQETRNIMYEIHSTGISTYRFIRRSSEMTMRWNIGTIPRDPAHHLPIICNKKTLRIYFSSPPGPLHLFATTFFRFYYLIVT